MRRALLFCFVSAISSGSLAAAAQDAGHDQAARQHFESGRAYFDRARYEDAIREFEEAFRLSGRKELLVNISRAREAHGDVDGAIGAIERWLALAPADDPLRADMESRRARLRLHAESLAARRADQPAAEPVPAAEPAPAPITAGGPTPAPSAVAAARSPVGFIVLGAGIAAAGVGATFVALGYRDIRTVEDPSPGSTWSSSEAAYERAPTRIGVGYALVGVGVAAAGLGIALRVGSGSEDDAPVAVTVAPNAVSVRGRF